MLIMLNLLINKIFVYNIKNGVGLASRFLLFGLDYKLQITNISFV